MTQSTDINEQKFNELHEKYYKLVQYIANDILKNAADAEDVAQQTFLYIWENIDKIGDVDSSKAKSYMKKIASSKAIDIYRMSKKTVALDPNMPDSRLPDTWISNLDVALEAIPTRYRIPLELRCIQGFSSEEIADILKMKTCTVQKTIWRGRNMLKQKLAEIT